MPGRARRYFAAAASGGSPFGSGLIDDFAAAILDDAPSELTTGKAVDRWPRRRGRDAHTADVFSRATRDDAAAQGRAAAGRRAAFLEALDALHAESFMAEDLGAGD